jgi:Cu2+-exporting ATPase
MHHQRGRRETRRHVACRLASGLAPTRTQIDKGERMKTSVIEVRDMLSVLGVDELEKRIGEVPGIGSATVNFAAGSATVRYDETRIEIADIKAAVRQRGYEPGAETGHDHPSHTGPGSPEASAPAAAASHSGAPATQDAATAGSAEQPKAAPSKASKTSPAVPTSKMSEKSPPDTAAPTPGAHAGHEQPDKTAPDKA